MKKIIALLLIAVMALAAVPVSHAERGADPSLTYVPMTAEYEDSQIQMWFNHANVKVHQEDTTSTGRNTYSVYMAKNEYQGTQVTLYSKNATKQNITARVENNVLKGRDPGNKDATMSAEIFYEYYIKCENLDETDVYGVANASQSFIREGIIPDAMAPISDINSRRGDRANRGRFTLTAGKTQTLYIKIKSEHDTPSGWYEGTFEVVDSNNHVIKTAMIYAYVWNFEIPDAVHCETAYYIDYNAYGSESGYKAVYDYLLDNRICAFAIPGELEPNNPYLTDPRVNAISVQDKKKYNCNLQPGEIRDIYTALSGMDDWETVKEKLYFYMTDEPTSKAQADALYALNGHTYNTLQDVINGYNRVKYGWPDYENAYIMTVFHENHPYPPGYNTLAAYSNGTYLTDAVPSSRFEGLDDAAEYMMTSGIVTHWVVQPYFYTPTSVLNAANYAQNGGDGGMALVRNMNGIVSGFDIYSYYGRYFNWDSKYGTFAERFAKYRNRQNRNIKLWNYVCGNETAYTYCNHLIENTGLQAELLFWQTMQTGATGLLYYGTNLWKEYSDPAAEGSSPAYDGTIASGYWNVNKYCGTGRGAYNVYGNGVLLYQRSTTMRIENMSQPLGTIRIENIRDGIEEYEMLYMYREMKGEEAMQNFIKKVSNNVVDYISMPSFNRSAYSSSMTDEDVFAAVRIELGDAIERGASNSEPEPEFAPGDVNCDTHITAHDLADLKCALVGRYGEGVTFESCDVNRDGSVNSHDVEAIKHIFVQ